MVGARGGGETKKKGLPSIKRRPAKKKKGKSVIRGWTIE